MKIVTYHDMRVASSRVRNETGVSSLTISFLWGGLLTIFFRTPKHYTYDLTFIVFCFVLFFQLTTVHLILEV